MQTTWRVPTQLLSDIFCKAFVMKPVSLLGCCILMLINNLYYGHRRLVFCCIQLMLGCNIMGQPDCYQLIPAKPEMNLWSQFQFNPSKIDVWFYHGYGGKHLGSIIAFYLVKIQGDGWKFPDCFKSYLGSQMPAQSLMRSIFYRFQPKSATKGDFFHTFLSFTSLSRCHGLQMVNEADKVLLGKRPH